ncbi:hypothetical protein PGT21_020098 [Puccinia graminis f. sp. tritici]|uniref:Transmembrane protein 188 n=1 Tax=Puccinia graminis f. sp. tritici TaxID=56615 RepID=A0A5B0P159_PUCGR|nr:hypothetical protein PGTUg99_020633 [Puccinia graminis f. sp. tritici]KAA1099652.1 hypothetical protein PGT21_016234 [Puccinia graminis f. sp. tritici]KAA1117697.1 hypothetical protein PGT21_020098 [Puccinia graminis f. sp. tritici]KAA1138077.1 hypothetical protein PGTUg99_028930 [Puccinia graminis f. sp. tritici]
MAQSNHQPFSPPPANRETYKDLLVFEERLKQNAERLQRQRIKYEAFLVTIIASSLLLAYKTFIAISPYKLIHYLYVALFLVSITTLILFFATGMYTDQIAYAYKFIPQTNRALRPFNMFLITPSTASSITRTNQSSGGGRIGSVLSRLSIGLIVEGLLGTMFRQLFQRPRRPPTAQQSPLKDPHNLLLLLHPKDDHLKNLKKINPRGELLFSSNVNPQFIDQYKLYRNQWEIRQKKS